MFLSRGMYAGKKENTKHDDYCIRFEINFRKFLKSCKLCIFGSQTQRDDWKSIECGGKKCNSTLTLDQNNAFSGFYKCSMFPYYVSQNTMLQVEITKTFQVDVIGKRN